MVCFSISSNSTRSFSEFFTIFHNDDYFVISLSVAIHSLNKEDASVISQNNDPARVPKKFNIIYCDEISADESRVLFPKINPNNMVAIDKM